jgi:hypothetical protein
LTVGKKKKIGIEIKCNTEISEKQFRVVEQGKNGWND